MDYSDKLELSYEQIIDEYDRTREVQILTPKQMKDLFEYILELRLELENKKKKDPKQCMSCSYRGSQVIRNGGRCNSCM